MVEPEPQESAAWSRRYAELQPRLVRALAATAGSYVGVEDAVHDAFAAALSADRAQISNLGGWLYTVALRTLRRAQRRDAFARALRLGDDPRPDDPGLVFPFGSDVLGRDLFSLVLAGAGTTLTMVLLAGASRDRALVR